MAYNYRYPKIDRKTQGTKAGQTNNGGRQPYAPPPPQTTTVAPPPPPSQYPQPQAPQIPPPASYRRPGMGMGRARGLGTAFQQERQAVQQWQPTEAAIRGAEAFGIPVSELAPDSWALQAATGPGRVLAYGDYAAQQQQRDFQELSRLYGENVARQIMAQTGAEVAAMQRGLRRGGAEYAGYLPAAEQAIRAAGLSKTAETLGEFQAQLAAMQAAERQGYRKQALDYMMLIERTLSDDFFQRRLQNMQIDAQKDASKTQLIGDIAGSIGEIVGMKWAGG